MVPVENRKPLKSFKQEVTDNLLKIRKFCSPGEILKRTYTKVAEMNERR